MKAPDRDMADADAGTAAARRVPVLGRVVEVRADEARALLWAFLYFFALLCGFYVLRPLREEMGIRGGVSKLHWVFTATFVVMLAAVPLFSALVARVPRARAVPWVYRFFILNLVVFYGLFRGGVAPEWTARAFFVWVSVYNLFVVSVFWSFMADVFSADQGRRLFGFVAAGGSAGALLGPALAAGLVGRIGIANLLLLSALLLEASARCALRLAAWARRARTDGAGERHPGRDGGATGAAGAGGEAPVGGSALAGFTTVVRSRYLRGIAAHWLLMAVGATFLYFQQARIVAQAFPDPARRTAIFAGVDLAVNVAALATQALATGRIVTGLGVGAALALVPAVSVAGFAVLALSPTFWVLGAVQALRRAGHYGLERPAREVLFTVVRREDKYKAKSFIDTAVFRGGDAVAGWMQAGLVALGLGIPGLSLAGIPIAAASVGLAFWLARRARGLERGGAPA
jgi:ATP:ADP antiporter, AAA family